MVIFGYMSSKILTILASYLKSYSRLSHIPHRKAFKSRQVTTSGSKLRKTL
jgi:hypothetical protein